ncbi:hypothetical protein ABD76_00370 [Paenibacillus dendritiformis]|nr:hypothetical protein [Paenibacillus dendritiformis]
MAFIHILPMVQSPVAHRARFASGKHAGMEGEGLVFLKTVDSHKYFMRENVKQGNVTQEYGLEESVMCPRYALAIDTCNIRLPDLSFWSMALWAEESELL